MKKILALGSQEFSEVIGNNCIYVDKTKDIYKLITEGKYYFLSRPRRFGKSLLANTLKEIFLGNKKLFKGLWIYDKWDWEKAYPVIKISFASIDHNTLGLETAIDIQLDKIAKAYGHVLDMKSIATKFEELIIKLSEQAQVAIIIDEYDKPIIDYIDELEKAKENLGILRNFYSAVKDADKYIRFFFVTGVSKFSNVSVFSNLNNLSDITLNRKYSRMIGWTEEEVVDYFPDYIAKVRERYENVSSDIMQKIREWYDGYSWDGQTRLYNPVSLMNLFAQQDFRNYWFETGTPTFLLKLIKEKKFTAFDIENSYISTNLLDKYEITKITLLALLFQTGYLTIKNYNRNSGDIILDYPNREVADSFSVHILSELVYEEIDLTDNLLYKIRRSFIENEIEDFIEYINTLFSNIPYNLIDRKEKYFHSLFYLVLKIIGYNVETEILTIKGRIDAVVRTDDNIYILEFKIDQSAQKAIDQIKERNYAQKYKDDKRPVSLLGINFDTDKKMIDDYIIELQ